MFSCCEQVCFASGAVIGNIMSVVYNVVCSAWYTSLQWLKLRFMSYMKVHMVLSYTFCMHVC